MRTTVSSKFQITLPAAVRRMLRVRPGDRLEFRIDGGRVELRKVLANPAEFARREHVPRLVDFRSAPMVALRCPLLRFLHDSSPQGSS